MTKFYWMTMGLGSLCAVIGAVVYVMSDHLWGGILGLGGITIAITGLILWFVDRMMGRKKAAE